MKKPAFRTNRLTTAGHALAAITGGACLLAWMPLRAVAAPPAGKASASSATGGGVRPLVGEVGRDEAADGDTLLAIAVRNRLAIDHLCFANGWPAQATGIYAGTPVVVPGARVLPAHPPRDGVVVNLPERGLFLFAGGRFVRFFPVSIGLAKECPTPLMNGHVVEKVKNPVWYPPPRAKQRKPIGPGPDNPLGDRWIGLDRASYGIHSTNRAVNIGLSTTRGCIRLYPDDIHVLYDRVRIGTPVRIDYETAKVGRRADGTLFLVTFPDVYGRSSPVDAARKALHAAGLDARWTAALEQEARRTRGLPISLEPATPATPATPRGTSGDDTAESAAPPAAPSSTPSPSPSSEGELPR